MNSFGLTCCSYFCIQIRIFVMTCLTCQQNNWHVVKVENVKNCLNSHIAFTSSQKSSVFYDMVPDYVSHYFPTLTYCQFSVFITLFSAFISIINNDLSVKYHFHSLVLKSPYELLILDHSCSHVSSLVLAQQLCQKIFTSCCVISTLLMLFLQFESDPFHLLFK